MRGMPEEERELRRLEMDKVWLKYTYQRPPREGDAFHMLLRGEGFQGSRLRFIFQICSL